MTTFKSPEAGHHVYIFAHQDDEYGALPWIEESIRTESRVSAIYLTDGGSRVPKGRRDAESLAALTSIGLRADDIAFLSEGSRIRDGELVENLERGARMVDTWLAANPGVTAMFAPAWEGGHPDHDAAHALALTAAAKLEILDASWQFSLYNGYRCRAPFFRVLEQIPSSACYRSRRHTLLEGLRYSLFCWRYPSQLKTWLGLFPQALFRRTIRREDQIVQFDVDRFLARPHDGVLLYERLFATTYDKVAELVAPLRASLSPHRLK